MSEHISKSKEHGHRALTPVERKEFDPMSDIQNWIKHEVDNNDVVLFMKGTPSFSAVRFLRSGRADSGVHGRKIRRSQCSGR